MRTSLLPLLLMAVAFAPGANLRVMCSAADRPRAVGQRAGDAIVELCRRVTVPAPPATGAQPSTDVQPAHTFTGAPVSLEFEGADLRAVLRTFADISGLNVVIDPAVRGTVDVAMRDVPWDQALDVILRANKLGYVIEGTIVRVAPLVVLADD